MANSAKPTSRATSRVCSTVSVVSAENSVSGMMSRRNSVVLFFSSPACLAPAPASSSVRLSPSPGLMMLPTTSPMARATVDMVTK
jgi:hypothetical protein